MYIIRFEPSTFSDLNSICDLSDQLLPMLIDHVMLVSTCWDQPLTTHQLIIVPKNENSSFLFNETQIQDL